MQRRTTVLVVDEKRTTDPSLRAALSDAGLAFRPVTLSRHDAVAYVARSESYRGRPRATDAAMIFVSLQPGDTSLDTLRWLRTRLEDPQTPIIVVATSPDEPGLRAALDAGADGYCVAPVSGAALRKISRRFGLTDPAP